MRSLFFLFLLLGLCPRAEACVDPYAMIMMNASDQDFEHFVAYFETQHGFVITQESEQIFEAISSDEALCHGGFTINYFQGEVGYNYMMVANDGVKNTCMDVVAPLIDDYLKINDLKKPTSNYEGC